MEARPAAQDDLVAPVFELLRLSCSTLQKMAAKPPSHVAAEACVSEGVEKIGQALLQAFVDRCHQLEVERARDDGTLAESIEAKRPLESTWGRVTVTRLGFERDGQWTFPLDTLLNLPPELYSLPVRRQVATFAAHVSFEQSLELMGEHLGAHVPKRQAEELTVRGAQDFDAFQARRPVVANDDLSPGAVRVATCDSKGIAVVPKGLRPATRKAAESAAESTVRGDPMAAKKPGKKHRKRMALVSAVYEQERHVQTAEQLIERMNRPVARAKDTEERAAEPKRPKPQHKTVSATLEKSQKQGISAMFDEVERRQKHDPRELVLLVDGEERQMAHVRREAKKRGLDATVVLDLLHVLHYLWTVALVLRGSREQASSLVVIYTRILVTQSPTHLIGILDGQIEKAGLKGEARKKAVNAVTYLAKNQNYLHYRRYLAKGYPIATGVIEGACRHLVQDRMGITGARWSVEMAEAVLRLRALETNGDTEAYWEFHEQQEFIRNHGKEAA